MGLWPKLSACQDRMGIFESIRNIGLWNGSCNSLKRLISMPSSTDVPAVMVFPWLDQKASKSRALLVQTET